MPRASVACNTKPRKGSVYATKLGAICLIAGGQPCANRKTSANDQLFVFDSRFCGVAQNVCAGVEEQTLVQKPAICFAKFDHVGSQKKILFKKGRCSKRKLRLVPLLFDFSFGEQANFF
jgi:hypothetical protein